MNSKSTQEDRGDLGVGGGQLDPLCSVRETGEVKGQTLSGLIIVCMHRLPRGVNLDA